MNFLFLIAIFRLDLVSKTMAKPQDQDNVLVHDEFVTTTSVYLDEQSFTTFSSTRIDDLNNLNNEANLDKNIDQNQINLINQQANNQPSDSQPKESEKNQESTFNLSYSTTTIPRFINQSRQLTRDEWLAKEYFSYLCGMCAIKLCTNLFLISFFLKS